MDLLMPHSRYKHLPFVILPDENLVVVKAIGTLMFDDLVGHPEDFMQDEKFYAGMNVIYDLSEVESLGGELEPLMVSAESLNCTDSFPIPSKTVFYTGKNETAGRMLEGFCIMTRYTRVPHFIANTLESVFSILEMAPIDVPAPIAE